MSNHTPPLILALDDATATLAQAGGKAASLARLVAAGLPVPAGFCVTTAAYRHYVTQHGLQAPLLATLATITADQPATLDAAAQQIGQLFAQHPLPDELAEAIQRAYAALDGGDQPVAVRSSATAEDLPELSFAGQQESFLNICGAAQVLDAVKRCWASLWTARAIDYRTRHGIAHTDVALAVVVQRLVDAEAAGVLFTADPLTGASDHVLINAAWGLGEAVVNGQVTPDTVTVRKTDQAIIAQQISQKNVMTVRSPAGTQQQPVPPERRMQAVLSPAQAARLTDLGTQIERLYGTPVDIEWALHNGQAAVLQARPITGLPARAPAAEQWNDSLLGDYLWTSVNLGEAVPDVMTPCTWSLMRIFTGDALPLLGLAGHPLIGNIGGHCYMNLSLLAAIGAAFGLSRQRFADLNQDVFGRLPAGLENPAIPLPRWRVLREMLPVAVRMRWRVRTNIRRLPAFIAAAPARCEALRQQIAAVDSPAALLALWQAELAPFFHDCNRMLEAGARRDGNALLLVRNALRRLVGETDANTLLSGLSAGTGQLASLGPLLGLAQVARGELDRTTYARQWGHRSPHEFEVSIARPAEDPDWIDRQLAGLREAPTDVETLLARQRAAQVTAWARLEQRHPRRAASLRRRIAQAAAAAHDREAARSEVVRSFWALRAFVLRAGVLSGLGEDVFFLSIHEILDLLHGDRTALARIPARRTAYTRYCALPSYPVLIRGHFDPLAWAADPQRRSDVADASGHAAATTTAINGFPGAAGVVEGRVRVLATADDGDQLQAGEVLVTTVTNIGWTPLFPRAAAIITDVGAPLSHAAIVARELGIPAVVGCGNATMRLHTGDHVRVNGGQGTVELLQPGGA